MRVFLDTNVLASAYATRGLCADVLREVFAEHELVIGAAVLEELERVLLKKFRVPTRISSTILAHLRKYRVKSKAVLPSVKIRDKDDVKILAEAISIGADVLVTGDKDFLCLDRQAGILIVTPRQFWELVRTPQ